MFTLVLHLIAGILVAINIHLSIAALFLSIVSLFSSFLVLNSNSKIIRLSIVDHGNFKSNEWLSFLFVLTTFLIGIFITTTEINKRIDYRVDRQEHNVTTQAVIENFPIETFFGQKALISTNLGRFQSFWPKEVPLRPGETWQITCTNRPVVPVISPGAFDPAKYSFLNGIDGNCSVTEFERYSQNLSVISSVRNGLHDWVSSQAVSAETQGIMLALLLGDKSGLTPQQKQLLRESHTSHLLVVSGLHLSLVFIIFFWLGGLFGRLFAIRLNLPASHFQWLAGMLSVIVYAALCGFPIPTQRAMVMLLVPFCFYFARQVVASDQVYWTAMILVLIIDPLAILSFSFWLSFLAVGILLLTLSNGQSVIKPRLKQGVSKWLKPQIVITIALTPLLWLMGLASNPASIFVNLLAIPLVSFLMIPLLIIMLLSTLVFPGFLLTMGPLFEVLVFLLTTVQQWGQAYQGTLTPDFMSIFIFSLASLFFILPRGLPGKWSIQILLLFGFFYQLLKPVIAEEGLNIYLLDVGQGQSAIVQQGRYSFMLDSGPGLPDGGAFKQVVLPFLDAHLNRHLDGVIYSHNDSDHVSGYLTAPMEITSPLWLFGEPENVGFNACSRDQLIKLEGLKLSIMAPFEDTNFSGNQVSCVVKIESEHGCILIPGDIDKLIEYAIVANTAFRKPTMNSCDVLVASHHGSSSSTSLDWLKFFDPKLFIFSAGKMNRFNHPNADVIERVESLNIPWLSTQHRGSIWIQLIQGKVFIRELNRSKFYWEFM